MQNFKISIITIVYNRKEFILDAIKSVQNQSWPNIEHIIIDGGSNDGTINLIQDSSYPNIKFISEKDNGIYDALNKGLKIASGDIVGIMHSDDFYASDNILSIVAKAFINYEIDAVYGDLDYISRFKPFKVVRRWRSSLFHSSKLSLGWMPPHPTLFIKRNLIESHGLYNTDYKISSDYDFILRYFKLPSFVSLYIPQVFVKMRIGGESNQTIKKIIIKSKEDYIILRKNNVGGILALIFKNIRKINQFF